MTKKFLTSLAAIAAFAVASPATAANYGEMINSCAAALQAQGVDMSQTRTKFKGIRGGSAKTLTLELIGADGSKKTASCKIRRGQVSEVSVSS